MLPTTQQQDPLRFVLVSELSEVEKNVLLDQIMELEYRIFADVAEDRDIYSRRLFLHADTTMIVYLHDQFAGFICGTKSKFSFYTLENMKAHELVEEKKLHQYKYLYIHSFAVDNTIQGHGIGKRTLQHYLQKFAPHYKSIGLICKEHLVPFYEKFNFSTLQKEQSPNTPLLQPLDTPTPSVQGSSSSSLGIVTNSANANVKTFFYAGAEWVEMKKLCK